VALAVSLAAPIGTAKANSMLKGFILGIIITIIGDRGSALFFNLESFRAHPGSLDS
jgi:hypothetical protein